MAEEKKRPRGHPPTGGIKPVEGMVQEMVEHEKNMTRQIKKQELNDGSEEKKQALSQDIHFSLTAIQNTIARGHVDLFSIEDVYSRTVEYFEACEKAGRYPSLMGLYSMGFGYNRSYIYTWMAKNPGTATTVFLQTVKEVIADILTNQSLKGNAQVIQAIFQLKNHFDHADKIEVRPASQENEELTADEVRKKYGVVIEVDPEE